MLGNNPLAAEFKRFPKGVQIKYLLAMRGVAQLMFDFNAAVFNALADREEGKPKMAIDIGGNLNVEGLGQVMEKVYGSDGSGNDDQGR